MNKSLTSTLLILIAIGLFFTFTDARYQEIKGLRLEAAEYQDALDRTSSLQEVMAKLGEQFSAFPTSEVARLEKILPDDINTVRLALDLDTMAGNHGISLENVRVDRVVDNNAVTPVLDSGSPYDKVTVTFSFLSTYRNFVAFTRDIEQSLRIMDIRRVSFTPTEAGLYEHEVTVETYWLK